MVIIRALVRHIVAKRRAWGWGSVLYPHRTMYYCQRSTRTKSTEKLHLWNLGYDDCLRHKLIRHIKTSPTPNHNTKKYQITSQLPEIYYKSIIRDMTSQKHSLKERPRSWGWSSHWKISGKLVPFLNADYP